MSKLVYDEIRYNGYEPETFQKAIEEVRNSGGKITMQANRTTIYYSLRRFVDEYNQSHPDDPTSLNEVFFILSNEPYNNRYSELVGGNKKIAKSQGKRVKKSSETDEMLEIEEKFIEPAVRKHRKKVSDEEMRNELKAITHDGKVWLYENKSLKYIIYNRALKKGISIEEFLKSIGNEVTEVGRVRENFTLHTDAERKSDILDCVDEAGNIVGLAAKHPTTWAWLRFVANSKGSYDIAINEFLGVKNGTFHYIGRGNSLSIYDVRNPRFMEGKDDIKKMLTDFIRERMDDEGYVHDFAIDKKVYFYIHQIKEKSGISTEEVLQIFVPEAKVVKHRRFKNESDIVNLLKSYDDGNGNVDGARSDQKLIYKLRTLAEKRGMKFHELVESYGLNFSEYYIDIDRTDYVIRKLKHKYGNVRDLTNLFATDPDLYGDFRNIRTFFPEGSMPTIEETINMFGYDYKGLKNRNSKITKEYVQKLLKEKLGDEKVVSSLGHYNDCSLTYAVVSYAAKIGKPISEALSELGYTYLQKQTQRTIKKMSLEQYEEYLEWVREDEEEAGKNSEN